MNYELLITKIRTKLYNNTIFTDCQTFNRISFGTLTNKQLFVLTLKRIGGKIYTYYIYALVAQPDRAFAS